MHSSSYDKGRNQREACQANWANMSYNIKQLKHTWFVERRLASLLTHLHYNIFPHLIFRAQGINHGFLSGTPPIIFLRTCHEQICPKVASLHSRYCFSQNVPLAFLFNISVPNLTTYLKNTSFS